VSATVSPAGAPDDAAAAERWAAVEQLFQQALTRDARARLEWLASASPDAVIRQEVAALLAAHDSRGVLDRLVDEVMGPMLPRRDAMTAAPVTLPAHSRYRVIERMGGGGMGVVYRARDERLERDVALKFLSPHLSADDVAKRRFLVEARAAAAIEHPNICTVHEIGDTDDGQLYIVMACYDGETLDRRIARGPMPLDDALRIAAEMARGLAKAHDRGIVHRDIKPANVMITADGLVKILDFGIAKLTDVTVTQTVGAIGTVAYMSPEQAFGETVDHRTDLWSLGVVFYEMLTGVRPFRGPGDQAVLVAALSAEPESVNARRPDVPPSVDGVIRRAMAKRAQDRFANAGELLAAVLACREGAVSSSSASRSASAADPAGGGSALMRGGERRQATVVACTIDGQATLLERLPPDDADRIIAAVRTAADTIAAEFGGIVNHSSGDELVMLFGVPVAHEDDAVRGVRAALALRAAVVAIASELDARLAAGLRLRAGMHTGQVVAQRLRGGDRQFRIAGAPADVAHRLASAAAVDAILLTPEASRLAAPFVLTEPAPVVAMHGADEPITPHRVVRATDVRSRLEGVASADLTPFVGREREREQLAEQCALTTAGNGGVTVLIGEAGAGKSRLLHELRATAASTGMRVLVGRCDAYGSTTPFLPFIDAVQDAFGMFDGGTASERHEAVVAAARAVDPALEEYLALYLALLAVPSEAHPVPEHLRGEAFPEAMLEALAVLLTLTARTAPTLLLLEDWHWADEASRGALRQLAGIVATFPLLLVVTSRPESAADWGAAEHVRQLHLTPLDHLASAAIACAVLGADRVAPALAARLHDRTGGNPFFLEEVCVALREEGTLVVTDGVADLSGDSASLHVPETVQGVLRTRMDRLPADAREVLRVAAVIGREFSRGVLEDVAPSRDSIAAALEQLKRSGLVQQFAVVPEAAYRFKHALTQEVAYDSLLEHQRVSLHASVGATIERRHAARLDEHAERLAYHFSRAESWTEAVRYGLLAADRASGLSQNAEALGTLERVATWVMRLPDSDARRDLLADVLLRQERISEMLGLRERQLDLVESLISMLAPFGPSERLVQVYLRQGDAFTLLNRYEAAERSLQTALRIATERADRIGERSALRSIAFLRSHEGRHADALSKIEEVLAIGRAIGDTRSEAGDLATLGNVLRALGQPDRALLVLERALERAEIMANAGRYGYLLNVVGTVHRDLGNLETALDYYRRTEPYMSLPHYASFTLPAVAQIHLQQGRVDEAIATAREAVELNRKARYADGSAMANRTLGEVLVGLERHAEAVPYLEEAAALYRQLQDHENELLMQHRIASVYELLGQPAAAHALWSRLREVYLGRLALAQAAEAAEGMARTGRRFTAAAPDAVAQYEDAIRLAVQHGDRARELSARNSLGIVHWERGAYADAVRQYEAALRICRETSDAVHEGLILNSLGASLHRLRRWDEARTVLADAVRVTSASGERQLHAHALGLLGEILLTMGRLDDARAHVEESLELRRRIDDRRGEGWMLERLARIRRAQGDLAAASAAQASAAAVAAEIRDAALTQAVAALEPVDPVVPLSSQP
jgi:tetratricopeptide (TPR) repeat protein/class 3 adenylate cyclase